MLYRALPLAGILVFMVSCRSDSARVSFKGDHAELRTSRSYSDNGRIAQSGEVNSSVQDQNGEVPSQNIASPTPLHSVTPAPSPTIGTISGSAPGTNPTSTPSRSPTVMTTPTPSPTVAKPQFKTLYRFKSSVDTGDAGDKTTRCFDTIDAGGSIANSPCQSVAGFTLERAIGLLLATSYPGTTTLYLCKVPRPAFGLPQGPDVQFLSLSDNCEGHPSYAKRPLGYVYPPDANGAARPGVTPLLRYSDSVIDLPSTDLVEAPHITYPLLGSGPGHCGNTLMAYVPSSTAFLPINQPNPTAAAGTPAAPTTSCRAKVVKIFRARHDFTRRYPSEARESTRCYGSTMGNYPEIGSATSHACFYSSDFQVEGQVSLAFKDQIPGSIPLWRCEYDPRIYGINAGTPTQFLSVSSNCEGLPVQSATILGYVYPKADANGTASNANRPGVTTLSRFWNFSADYPSSAAQSEIGSLAPPFLGNNTPCGDSTLAIVPASTSFTYRDAGNANAPRVAPASRMTACKVMRPAIRSIVRGKKYYSRWPGNQRCYSYDGDQGDICFSNYGYSQEGFVFNVFRDQIPGTVALRRCHADPLLTYGLAAGDLIQFLSVDSGGICDNVAIVHSDVLGYVYPNSPQNGSLPGVTYVTRMWDGKADYVSTSSPSEPMGMGPEYIGNARGQHNVIMGYTPRDGSFFYTE